MKQIRLLFLYYKTSQKKKRCDFNLYFQYMNIQDIKTYTRHHRERKDGTLIFISRVFNQVAYNFFYNILGDITTFNLCFNVRTFIQSFKRTFKKSEYIRMQIRFPSYARIINSGHLLRAFC